MLHCGEGISCKDLYFLIKKQYIRRAGIIPFRKDCNNNIHVLLGYSNEKNPVWADLGGRAEKGETTLETALREFGEESRWILDPVLKNVRKIIVTGKNNSKTPDQTILFIEYPSTPDIININDKFKCTVPTSQYEDEMQYLKWIPYQDFLKMTCITDSLKEVIKILNTSK
jgi:ADP-ribose pyrophosphatase YjhB (NUDIX family)